MILADDVLTHLIDKLAEVYPKPATAKGIAARVAAAAGEWVRTEDLAALAERIISTRDAKTFPSVPTLMTMVKAIPERADAQAGVGAKVRPGRVERVGGVDRRFFKENDRLAALDEAERRAIALLRGTQLAQRAIAEGWAVGLIDFAIIEGMAPGFDDEIEIVAKVRATDVDVRDFVDKPDPVPPRRNMGKVMMERIGGKVGEGLRNFRAAMHETAARKLTSEAS